VTFRTTTPPQPFRLIHNFDFPDCFFRASSSDTGKSIPETKRSRFDSVLPLWGEFPDYAVLLPDLLLLSHLQRVLLRGDMVWREVRGIAI